VGCGHRGPAGGEALTPRRAGEIAAEARSMGARAALVTGGEPLLRRDLDALLAAVGGAGLSVTLLTNGLALRRRAAMVAARCDAVVVSLDGHDRATYAATRGIDGLGAVAAGIAALRAHAPQLPVTARVTVTAANADHLRRIVERAGALGVDGVSLLAADTDTAGALGRAGPVSLPPVDPARLAAELAALRGGPLRRLVTDSDFALDRLVHRARAAAGLEAPRAPPCDAPHTSAVVTADLTVRPCFFLPATGDAAGGLEAALEQGRAARAAHDVAAHPTCARCVCWARLA
jgi:MoaA/NifB/PqqE/SkfB family radical SAM enzyme